MRQTKLQSKLINLLLSLIVFITLWSCGNKTSHLPTNSEGFTIIEKALKSKFGNNAYYTDLSISYNESVGNIIAVTVTELPESLTMGQWNLMQNTWKQNQEITLEVPEGTKASDYMFQLNDNINLTQLGELAEKSSKQLTAEKNIKSPTLSMAFVKFPKNGDIKKTEYIIILQPENGGTTFKFYYNLSGELIKMNY